MCGNMYCCNCIVCQMANLFWKNFCLNNFLGLRGQYYSLTIETQFIVQLCKKGTFYNLASKRCTSSDSSPASITEFILYEN